METLNGVDIFDCRTLSVVAATFPLNEGYITDMVSVGKEVFAVYHHDILLHSKDEGETWRVALPAYKDAQVSISFLAVDEIGLEGKPNGIYLLGNRKLPDLSTKIITWYKAPGQDGWVQRESEYFASNGDNAGISGFSCGKLGLAFVTRFGFPMDNKRYVHYSTDGGLTWAYYDLTATLAEEHCHDIWMSPYEDATYVTTGDSYVGASGVVKTDDFANWTQVYAEVPGFRCVPVWGGKRSRMFGVEHSAGAVMLYTPDDARYEVRFGRTGHEFANFRSLKQSLDGLTVMGTYQYNNLGNVVKSFAGSLQFSDDEGITFKRLRVPTDRISGIAITPNYVFCGGGWTDHDAVFFPYIVRVSREYIQALPLEKKVIKPVRLCPVEATTAQCQMAVDGYTFLVNMTPYDDIRAYIRVLEAGELTIEGRLYDDQDVLSIGGGQWDTLAVRTYTGATTEWVDLTDYNYYAMFRVKNTGDAVIGVREVSFCGTLGGR